MATVSLRSALLRSLPALLLFLTLGLAAPQTVSGSVVAGVTQSTSSPTAPAIAGSTADTPDDVASPATAPARTPGAPVAGRARVLSTQFAAGASGSRAPPLLLA